MGNNPVSLVDPDGRFSTRSEARQFRRDENIGGIFNIRSTSTGDFYIKDGQTSWYHGYGIKGGFSASVNFMSGVQAVSYRRWYHPRPAPGRFTPGYEFDAWFDKNIGYPIGKTIADLIGPVSINSAIRSLTPTLADGSLVFKYDTDMYGEPMSGFDRFINTISIVPLVKPASKFKFGTHYDGEAVDFLIEKIFETRSIYNNVNTQYFE
jgi:hypothetical protein